MALADRLAAARAERPALDHALRTQEHYSAVKGGQQAGGMTYYGFLSFFPVLALAVFVVGLVSRIYPDAQSDLRDVIDDVLPGIIGNREGQISLADIRTFSGWAAVIGVLGVLYSGLGWLSSMREALIVVFEKPAFEQPNFVIGKLRDLLTLATVGATLFVSVAVTGFVRGFSDLLLDLVGLDTAFGWLVGLITIVVGLAVNALLFFLIFQMLARPEVPRRSLVQGALLGAVTFELLKLLSQFLLGATRGQPAFQAFGIALILVVWINYFSRVVLYSASFAWTTAEARALRTEGPPPVQGPQTPPLAPHPAAEHRAVVARGPGASPVEPAARRWVTPFAGGAAAMLGLVAVLRRGAKD